MKKLVYKALFRAWPFAFGHVALMGRLRPPPVDASEVTTRLKRYGLRFQYDPNSYIGRFIYYRGLYEETLLRTMESCLSSGMAFIDVGANVGQHSVVASKLVGPTGFVYSFEPQTGSRARLSRNVELNGLRNVIISDLALGKESARANIYQLDEKNDGMGTLNAGGKACASEPVSIETLDSVMQGKDVSRGCVIKIDVEGGEMDVLQGSQRFLKEAKPKAIFVECCNEHLKRFSSSSAGLIRWLQEAGYMTRGLQRGRWVPVDHKNPIDCDLMASL